MEKILYFIYLVMFYFILGIAGIMETIIKIISFILLIPTIFVCMIITVITRKSFVPTWIRHWYTYCEKFSDYKSIKYLLEVLGN